MDLYGLWLKKLYLHYMVIWSLLLYGCMVL